MSTSRKWYFRIFLLGLLSSTAISTTAQTPTVVTGTIKDSNGIPYSNAKVSAQLIPTTASPTIIVNGIPTQIGGQQNATTDANGNFSMNLFCNSAGGGCSVISPSGTTWQITANENGVPPPLGTGPQACSATLTITGASQPVSSSFSACPALSNGGGSGTALSTTPTNLMPRPSLLGAMYWMLPTETPTALIDYSGNGNNIQGVGLGGTGTAAIQATFGGISCDGINGSPLKVPAALNPTGNAITILIFTRAGGTGGPFQINQEPISGNGGGARGHYIAIDYTGGFAGAASSGFGRTGYTLASISEPGTGTGVISWSASANPGAPGVVALVVNSGGTPAMYWNGFKISASAASSDVGQTLGNLQLCGAAANNGGTVNTWFNGFEGPVAIYPNTSLTDTEVFQASTLINQTMALRGFDLNQCVNNVNLFNAIQCNGQAQAIGNGTPVLNIEGDSLMSNNGAGSAFSLTTANGTVTTINNSFTGQANCSGGGSNGGVVDTRFATAAAIADRFVPGTAEMNWTDTDDASSSGTTLLGCSQASAAEFQRLGIPYIMVTMLDRTGLTAKKNAVNTSILQNGQLFNIVANMAGFANVGADNSCSVNITFCPDGTHPAGFVQFSYEILSMSAAYNHLFGAKDYTTATTDTVAPVAATNTTAVSEVGNIVTVTTAGTPTSCTLPDATVIVAGVTASSGLATGYNSSSLAVTVPTAFKVLTNDATHITYFNGNTGLGAASVQGTIQCPNQTSADNFKILNFGANPNPWLLQDAALWSGGSGAPDRKVHISNISAAASVIGGFNSQLINGVATLSIAAHTSIILSSLCTTAAGCSGYITESVQ